MNGRYRKSRQLFLEAGINWKTDTIKSLLVKTAGTDAYLVDLNNHMFLTDVPVHGIIASTTLTNTDATNGVASASAAKFSPVSNGANIGAILVYKDTGSSSTSPLICYIDTITDVVMPIVADGTDIIIQWDLNNGIFTN